jgi:hypothetical protein
VAVEDREPQQERPGELPRRVPGVHGRTPGQIRRGYLPIPGAPSSGTTATDADSVPAKGPGLSVSTPEAPAQVLSPKPQAPAAGPLPRRAPGASAIQSPPETLRRPRLPEPLSRESMSAAQPSPTSLASSAAKLLSASAAPAVVSVAAPLVPTPAPAPESRSAPAVPVPLSPPPTAAPAATTEPAATAASSSNTAAAPTATDAADAGSQPQVTAQLTHTMVLPEEPGLQNKPGLQNAPGLAETTGLREVPGPQTTGARNTSPLVSVPQTAIPSATAPPRAASPSGTPPPPAAWQIADTSATLPGPAGTKQQTTDRARPARRWRLAGFLIAVVLVAVVVAITLRFGHEPAVKAGAAKSGAAHGPTASNRQITAEAGARAAAVTWLANQVGHDIIIACDTVICSDLAQHGFPASSLNVLQPTAPDPYGAELVIATAGVRSQFGSRLAAVYAPEVIASFGTGATRIDVRVIAPRGPAAFRAALRADLLARKASGAQLLRNQGIRTSATARAQLAAGHVDKRLLTIIAFMAHQQPLDIVDFGSIAPGESPSVPLRYADLAVTNVAPHLASHAYRRTLIALAHSEVAPYVPLSVGTVRLAGGQTVVRIEFAAPSPVTLPS